MNFDMVSLILHSRLRRHRAGKTIYGTWWLLHDAVNVLGRRAVPSGSAVKSRKIPLGYALPNKPSEERELLALVHSPRKVSTIYDLVAALPDTSPWCPTNESPRPIIWHKWGRIRQDATNNARIYVPKRYPPLSTRDLKNKINLQDGTTTAYVWGEGWTVLAVHLPPYPTDDNDDEPQHE